MTYWTRADIRSQNFEVTNPVSCYNGKRSIFLRHYKAELSSGNSPHINGVLQPKENELTHYELDNRGDCLNTLYTYKYLSSCKSLGIDPQPSLGFSSSLPITRGQYGTNHAYYSAVNKFYGDLSNLKINVAQALAERQQTIDLIATNTRRLAGLYSSLRRGRNPFRRGQNTRPNDAAKLWLEYSYGWVPLVSDVYGAMELQKLAPPVRHKAVSHRQTARSAQKVFGPYEDAYKVYAEYNATYLEKACIIATLQLNDPGVAFANSLGLTNPALLAWELVPYSFVVDWFVPIGGWLEMQNSLLGFTVKSASQTWTLKGSIDASLTSKGYGSYNASGSGSANVRFLDKKRDLSLPPVRMPRIKNPCSISHALSALSLLSVSFSKR